jgi:protein SCO1/2
LITSVSSFRGASARLALALFVATAAVSSARAAPAVPATPASVTALPGDSIYQLPIMLTGQDGRTARLDLRRGAPVLISMFYTSCKYVCPMLIETVRDVESKLSVGERENLGVVLVSIDPEHDSVEVLKRTADERRVDGPRWTLARTDAASVRKLAAVLGIQYRALVDGEFNHTTAVILLDGEGRIAARTSRLGGADPAFVKRVRSVALAASR